MTNRPTSMHSLQTQEVCVLAADSDTAECLCTLRLGGDS